MTRRNLPVVALAAAALLAIVALVAHGRPLASSAGRGNGVPLAFWDYVITGVVFVLALLVLAIVVSAILGEKAPWEARKSSWKRTVLQLAGMLAVAALVVRFGADLNWKHLHLHVLQSRASAGADKGGPLGRGKGGAGSAHPVHFRWDEVAIVVGLLLAAVALVVARQSRRSWSPLPGLAAPAAVVAALDESLDDLRSDPDLRRAIVAAYARMEAALGRAGVPRRPADAPLEYIARALLELDLDAPAVHRLTELFEWARFSHHEPEPSMRDEAIDALVTIRDSLLAPARAAA